MSEKQKFPKEIMETLRRRIDLDSDDTSMDVAIAEYTPMDALTEVVAWHLGDPQWASTFCRWARGCGLEISARKDGAR